ncbi:TetR/AcrR family transcriptional regulator [Amycolatopsis solani]|uniref:TetR/AcrR family transcriptional regulator n=1 Tax=Amycolatopsis solani TaxID=3028615 RepID=UPI0025B14421|nr:TetR/AcrR family transcriptional regulator [Amycolatopsis sp. MEP2-6]
MNFKRARTDEQRAERRRAILATADALLAEMPVAELSFNELSRRVGLAKANIVRYVESREAVLLDLLDRHVRDWIAELAESAPGPGSVRERGDRLARLVAESVTRRPVLCDLISSQAAVLERNVSTEVALEHKRALRRALESLVAVVRRHVPELTEQAAYELVGTAHLVTAAAWPHSRPSEALRAAYELDPAVAATRVDFTELVRRTLEVAISGLLARERERPTVP